MPKVLGVNGIHSHGINGTAAVLGQLVTLGHEVRDYRYPKRNALTVWPQANRWDDAEGLMTLAEPGDHLVCHSYGCLIALEAMAMGAEFGLVFMFNAAASSDRRPWWPLHPRAAEKVFVVYNPEDKALRWGARIPFHPFGKLGYKGYRGPHDRRVINLPQLIDDGGTNHNDSLHDEGRRDAWVKFIDHQLLTTK